MSEKKEYLSVAEFAKLAGISRQQVYNRMKTDLSSYVVELDNKKALKIDVLRVFSLQKQSSKIDLSSEVNTLKRLVDLLESDNEWLKKENIRLQKELEEERQLNRQQNTELLTLSSQIGESLRQFTTERAAIEAKSLADVLLAKDSQSEPKRHWWQRKK